MKPLLERVPEINEGLERAREAQTNMTDWWAVCRRCGQKLEGSLVQLKAHKCREALK